MEEKKEMTLFERLNERVDNYEEAERKKKLEAEAERREFIYDYIQRECLSSAGKGGYRHMFCEGEMTEDESIQITIEDVVGFVDKNHGLEKEFYGNEKVEVIWRKGRPQFYEEPSAESATEAIEKMVAGMTKEPKSGEDDDETAEKDLMGPLSEEETADVVGRLRRATSERQAEVSEENYSFDIGV